MGSLPISCGTGDAFSCAAAVDCCVGDDEYPSDFASVDLGFEVSWISAAVNTCVITADDGRVSCWGPGYRGVLGPDAYAACAGGTDCSVDPDCCVGDDEEATDAAVFDFGRPARQVSVGPEHACVLLDDDTVRCWGEGAYGRLGYGDEEARGDDEPVTASGPVQLGARPVFVSAGVLGTCAALDDGTVRCWGACAGPLGVDFACLGQIGDPDTWEPIGDDEVPVDVPAVVAIGDGVRPLFVSVEMGAFHTCATVLSGGQRCWGDDIDGADGNPDRSYPAIPSFQLMHTVGTDGRAGSIAVGSTHACATLSNDVDWENISCWGRAALGATGTASTVNPGEMEYPVYYPIEAPPPQVLATGDELTCIVAIDEDVYCWGGAQGPAGTDGAHGHPGLGNIGDDETPASAGPVSVW